MNNPFYSHGKLKDKNIIRMLHKAAEWYEDGAIAETKEILAEIHDAITEWEMDQEELYG